MAVHCRNRHTSLACLALAGCSATVHASPPAIGAARGGAGGCSGASGWIIGAPCGQIFSRLKTGSGMARITSMISRQIGRT